jgi:hypothetical protein
MVEWHPSRCPPVELSVVDSFSPPSFDTDRSEPLFPHIYIHSSGIRD